ncbi:ArsR/SmtB family transcription factor [Ligilactobacillus sp. LYQ135]
MIEIFKALSDQTRIDIVQLIANNPNICGCEIADVFETSQGTISHHMKILVTARLILDNKKGRSHYYTVNKEKFDEIVKFVNKIN